MNIAENLERIKTAKADIKAAIESKGVYVDEVEKIDGYASKIYEIQTGQGSCNLIELKDNFEDYGDGKKWWHSFDYNADGFNYVEIDASEYGNQRYSEGYNDGLNASGGKEIDVTTEGDGTFENPYNVGQARNIGNGLEENGISDTIYVKGIAYEIQDLGDSMYYYIHSNDGQNIRIPDGIYEGDDLNDGCIVIIKGNITRREPWEDAGYVDVFMNEGSTVEYNGCSGEQSECECVNPVEAGMKFAYSEFTEIPDWVNPPQGITNLTNMFANCTKLTDISRLAEWDVSNVKTIMGLFKDCTSLTDVTALNGWNLSKIDSLNYIFSNTKITEAPSWDTSHIEEITQFLDGCYELERIPKYNLSGLRLSPNIFGFYTKEYTKLTFFGGFEGLKYSINNNYAFTRFPNLTYESWLNIINGLYDFTGNGETPASNQGSLKLHPNAYTLLTEDDIAIATNKGWVLL